MNQEMQDVKDIKGIGPRSIVYASEINEEFGNALSDFYKSVWKERNDGLNMKQKHLLVFTVACSNMNIDSALKILEKLKKFNTSAQEIKDAMMIAAWTSGIQNFTNYSSKILKEMKRLEFL